MDDPNSFAPLWDHIEAFRLLLVRILITVACGFATAFLFYDTLLAFVCFPLSGEQLALLSPTEGLVAVCRCCFWFGLVATSPIWLFLLLLFVAPGLYSSERRLIAPFFAATLLFFSCGSAFAYGITLPFAVHYLKLFNANIGINVWSLSYYLDFSLLLILANGLAFEGAVILFFLIHFRVVSPDTLARRRREVFIAILLLSALLTPPDFITQLLLAAPLTLLYEAAILYGKKGVASALKQPPFA